jgi:hypothetical protein
LTTTVKCGTLVEKEKVMSNLAKLRLVASKKQRTVSPVVQRRNKLVNKIHEQLELATAQKEGRSYAPQKLRTFVNRETGERRTVEMTKRVKEWYWTADTGKINLNVRYGSKVLELAKGKNAVELANRDELIQTLALLKEAVIAGELDEAISSASDKLRSGFVK